ncbi:MFS transporter [Undibacterium squillarum]|uniref:MFS transporter n=1 Tax=Undibacterium squillarum TaxID=1131567 RepID=UPI0035ADD627
MSNQQAASGNPIRWVPTLYLAEGLPFYAVALVAGLMYKSMGISNDQIARWTGLIGMAWVFKCLWSPFLEAAPSKKKLVVIFQAIGGITLGLVALSLQMSSYFAISIALFAVVAIASGTHDIAADGLYISTLEAKQQAAYAGWQGAFFNAAKFISLGGLVILAGHLEKQMSPNLAWGVIFALLAAMLLALSAYHVWALPDTRSDVQVGSTAEILQTLQDVIIDFLRKPGIWLAILFIILFRAGEAQIQTIGPLFLRELKEQGGLGLSTDQVGIVYGTAGTLTFLAGSILGGYFTSWLGLKKAMPWLIIAMNVPNLVFFYLSTQMPESMLIIGTALSLEMFGYGFGFVGLILFIMQVVAPGKYQTAHYALGTGVMQLGFVLFKTVSGDIQIALGYQHFFLFVLLCGLPSLILTRFLPLPDNGKLSETPGIAAQAQPE